MNTLCPNWTYTGYDIHSPAGNTNKDTSDKAFQSVAAIFFVRESAQKDKAINSLLQ